MDIDDLYDLQFGLNEEEEDIEGSDTLHKRPLTEISLNGNSPSASRNGKRARVHSSHVEHYDDDDVEELLALAEASQQMPLISASCATAAPAASVDHKDLQQERAAQAGTAQAALPADEAAIMPDQQAAGSDVAIPAQDTMEAAQSPCLTIGRPARNAADVEGDYIPVTSDTGERVYCGMSASTSAQTAPAPQKRMHGQFLSQPIDDIMQEIERAAYERALHESAPSAKSSLLPDRRAAHAAASHKEEDLWVDKYTPRSFLELLGDDEINREVVRWLKSWDKCVFGERHQPGHRAQKASAVKSLSTRQNADERPREKILLICGSPGLGKTTLAHVVAKHCGYRPVEINASDDRTAANLTARVNDAVQMQSVLGSCRPNCVIIDEIDGATGGAEGRGAIQALLKIIQAGSGKGWAGSSAEAAEEVGEDGGPGEKSKRRGKKGPRPLWRPLIAICNDLYAPALRPLRAVAKILHFKKPAVDRICSRLTHICRSEGISINRQAMMTLCDRTEHDVRACLNTLQFLAKRTHKIGNLDVQGVQCGQKDMVKSAFGVWQELFSRAAPKGTQSAKSGSHVDIDRLYSSLAEFGDHELVLSGLHENFSRARYMDTHMARTAAILDHLAEADCLLHRVHRRSDFAALKFAPAHAVAVRGIVAGPQRVQLTWPTLQADVHRRGIAQKALLDSWLMSVQPNVFATLSSATAVQPSAAAQDVLPALVRVVDRPLRPVAPHLFTVEERAGMAAMVDLLLAHGLTLELGVPEGAAAAAAVAAQPLQQGVPDVTPLSPPVHTLALFKGIDLGRKPMSITMRQMVVHQVQMEAIRRREEAMGLLNAALPAQQQSDDACEGEPACSTSQAAAESSNQRPPSGERRYQLTVAQRAKDAASAGVKKAGPQRKASWLDTLRQKSEKASQHRHKAQPTVDEAPKTGGGKAVPGIRYKFHEGFTNAVKRPVRTKDLL